MAESVTDAAIGRRLRSIREANGLSQRELARRAGVTNSSISMIEQGQVSPGIGSLEKLLAVFPMSLAHFFSVDASSAKIDFFKAPAIEATSIQPLPMCEFSALSPAAGVSLKRLQLPPLGEAGGTCLTNLVAQVIWVLAGKVQVCAGEQVRELGADEGLSLPAYCSCTVSNTNEAAAVILVAAELPSREL